MANKIRIKRRANGGGAGAPASLENAELAFNEQTNDALCYSGTDSPHFREKIKGKYCHLAFFHFVPVDFIGKLD